MSNFYDLLENLQKRAPLYLGRSSVFQLQSFLYGYTCAKSEMGIEISEDEKDFQKFQEWLENETGVKTRFSWAHILAFRSTDERAALDLFFKMLDKFKARSAFAEDVIDSWVDAIPHKHLMDLTNLQISILAMIQDSNQVISLEEAFSDKLNIPDLLNSLISSYRIYYLKIIQCLNTEVFPNHISLLKTLDIRLCDFLSRHPLTFKPTENKYWENPEWVSVRESAIEVLQLFEENPLNLSHWIQVSVIS